MLLIHIHRTCMGTLAALSALVVLYLRTLFTTEFDLPSSMSISSLAFNSGGVDKYCCLYTKYLIHSLFSLSGHTFLHLGFEVITAQQESR